MPDRMMGPRKGPSAAAMSGMVIDVEPFYWDWDRKFALHIEDTALVTDKGAVILSDATNTEELFLIT